MTKSEAAIAALAISLTRERAVDHDPVVIGAHRRQLAVQVFRRKAHDGKQGSVLTLG